MKDKTPDISEDYDSEIVRFSDLNDGDLILSSDGTPTKLTAAYEEHIPQKMFEIVDDNNEVHKVSGNHLWYIITDNDYGLHSYRLELGKKLGKNIAQSGIDLLTELAKAPSREVSVREMLDGVINYNPNKPNAFTGAFIRTAESVGPIAERNYFVDYLDETSEPTHETTMIFYDSRRFAQQLLSLFNVGKSRKEYPLLVGRVVTTEDIAEMDLEQIYIPNPKG